MNVSAAGVIFIINYAKWLLRTRVYYVRPVEIYRSIIPLNYFTSGQLSALLSAIFSEAAFQIDEYDVENNYLPDIFHLFLFFLASEILEKRYSRRVLARDAR